MGKFDRSYLRYTRYIVQWFIVFFLLYSGYIFFLFVDYFSTQSISSQHLIPPVSRPPSVEGFLPIGSFMAFKLWVSTGFFDRVHPAGLIIFISALSTAVILKKSFCGWICPVGALSDGAFKLGKKIFGKNFIIHRYVDYALRAVKYILMLFFIYVIVIKMPPSAISAFLREDYYKVADVKMLYFFTRMTTATLITLLVFFIFSLLYKNFWCRYLCPYGALLGLLSFLSPLKITRNEEACIHCGRCTENCPSLLPVEKKARIRSPECTGCLTCVSYCPAKDALDVAVSKGRALSPVLFAVLILSLFFGIIETGKITGRWHSSVTNEEYVKLIPKASSLEHP